MKRFVSKAALAAAVLMTLIPAAAFAATANISLSGDNSVYVGQTMSVTVTYRANSLGYVNGGLTYNQDRLEYLSGGSSQGSNGYVQLRAYAGDAGGKISFQLKFKGLKTGKVDLKITTIETQNLDGNQEQGRPSAGKTITVLGTSKAATIETVTGTSAAGGDTAATAGPTQTAGLSDQAAQDHHNMTIWIVCGVVCLVLILAIIAMLFLLRKKKK